MVVDERQMIAVQKPDRIVSDEVYVHRSMDAPKELQLIQHYWTKCANGYGDTGSLIQGAGFIFKYHGVNYRMEPTCQWQGASAWEHCVDEIQQMLIMIGATEIDYEWGTPL